MYTTKCIPHKCTQKVYKCIDRKAHSGNSCTIYKKCTKMCAFCIHFSSKCKLQNVDFINVHKNYINVYKMYRS